MKRRGKSVEKHNLTQPFSMRMKKFTHSNSTITVVAIK